MWRPLPKLTSITMLALTITCGMVLPAQADTSPTTNTTRQPSASISSNGKLGTDFLNAITLLDPYVHTTSTGKFVLDAPASVIVSVESSALKEAKDGLNTKDHI